MIVSARGISPALLIHLTLYSFLFFFVWADCVTFSCTALSDTQRHMWLDEVVPLEEFQETAGVFFSLPTSVYG